MARQSEIFLANSTKKTASCTSSRPANENKTAESDVVPIMKLSAIDIAENGIQDSGAPIIKMPTTSQSSTVAANGITETKSGGAKSNGSEYPEGIDDADAVTDPELLELLEQLSVTIDTANNVLGAAPTAPPGVAVASSNPRPAPEPEPEPDIETDDPPPLAAQFASLSPGPQPPLHHKQNQHISKVTTAIITGLALTAGVGWLLYSNPWLMNDGSKVAIAPNTSESSPNTSENSATRLANAAPAAVPAPTQTNTGRAAPQVQRQPVIAPKFSVSQSVAGKAGQPIALSINLPASATQTEISIMIQGVPDKTRLSAGKSLGSGNWLLSETELRGLTLNAGASFAPGTFNLDVILVRSDGKVPEVHKLPVTIKPTSARAVKTPDNNGAGPPPSSATTYIQSGITVAVPTPPSPEITAPVPEEAPSPEIAAPAPPAPSRKVAVRPAPAPAVAPPVIKSARIPTISLTEVRALLARANTLLEQGDVTGARLLLEYAAQQGSKRAMLKMGETFDPDHLAKLGVRGVFPDQDQATLWYERAAKAVTAQ